jgi:hypothetical protein
MHYPLAARKLASQRRHILHRDAPLQPIDAIHRHDRNAVAVAFEERIIAANVDLVQREGVGRRQIFEIFTRLVAEMAPPWRKGSPLACAPSLAQALVWPDRTVLAA